MGGDLGVFAAPATMPFTDAKHLHPAAPAQSKYRRPQTFLFCLAWRTGIEPREHPEGLPGGCLGTVRTGCMRPGCVLSGDLTSDQRRHAGSAPLSDRAGRTWILGWEG